MFSNTTYISARDLGIDRRAVTIEELMGTGHFGNVYKGSFVDDRGLFMSVAVKVCKDDCEPEVTKNFLEEAFIMHKFHHPHIIKLIGMCTEIPVWIVMELAPYGELREYLKRERISLDLSVLILFAHQLSSAVCYLHARKFVHRDIAARNVLVVTPRCVKLSDFGLSRCVDEDSFYTASRGKLPIKWMAPESINFRRFSAASDVWMFGVCIWEILMFGVKPWNEIKNHDVILYLESSQRLHRPPNCPQVLFKLLVDMWAFEPSFRVDMKHVKHVLNHLLNQIDQRIPFEQLSMPDTESNPDTDSNGTMSDDYNLKRHVPVLRCDASAVPTSTLWRALEQQRIQCEEDDRWLEEEEEKMLPNSASPMASPTPFFDESPTDLDKPKLPFGYDFDRSDDVLHAAVFRVVQSVSFITKTFTHGMAHDRFVRMGVDITEALGRLLIECDHCLKELTPGDQRQVQLVQVLLESDHKRLTEALKIVEDGKSEPDLYETNRKTVLKIAHVLAVNCKHFQDSVDAARIRSNVAHLKKKVHHV
uniref:receptor protein-tyrosine kinase n=1 Tax=Steinernema glaseri TaxID=37863 RepID=A0A1I7ZGS0_9BILA